MFVSEHLHKGTQAMPTISEVAGTRQGPGLRGGAGGSSVSGPLWPLSVARVRVSSLIVVLSHRTFGNSMKVVDTLLVHGLGDGEEAARGRRGQCDRLSSPFSKLGILEQSSESIVQSPQQPFKHSPQQDAKPPKK